MQAFLIYLLKATICSGILLLYYWIVLRNKRFHYYNRFYLLMSVALSLLLPVLNIELWYVESNNGQVINFINAVATNSAVIIAAKENTFYWINAALLLYAAAALIMLISLVTSIGKLYNYRHMYPAEKIGNVLFINTNLEQAPFSFFNHLFWKNTIDPADATGHRIFKHELTHIEQKHSWDKLFLRLTTMVLWLNPFYWFIQKELTIIHEFIADEKAITDNNTEAFALMLLQSQWGKNIFSPAQSFNYSPIKRRLVMLTTSSKTNYSYARRIMILPLLAATILLFAFRLKKEEFAAKQPTNRMSDTTESLTDKQYLTADTTPVNNKKKTDTSNMQLPASKDERNADTNVSINGKPDSSLVVIDGKIADHKELNLLNPGKIMSINVLKGQPAISKYGEKGKNGVIEVTMKDISNKAQQTPHFAPPKIVKDETVYPENDSAVSFTGDTRLQRNITTESNNNNVTHKDEQYEKVFKTVQVPPSFPGGNDAWLKYLQANLKSEITVINKAPAGSYTVQVSFVVDEDGNVSKVKAITDPGFGTGAEAVRVITNGPKWIPAKQNGHIVAAMTKQAVTFKVEE